MYRGALLRVLRRSFSLLNFTNQKNLENQCFINFTI